MPKRWEVGPLLILLNQKLLPILLRVDLCYIVQNSVNYVGNIRELKELWRPFVGAIVSLF